MSVPEVARTPVVEVVGHLSATNAKKPATSLAIVQRTPPIQLGMDIREVITVHKDKTGRGSNIVTSSL